MASFESPLEPFESPKELINGAKERVAELEAVCQAVRETREYDIVTHSDPKTREQVVKIRLRHKFPPKIRRLASSILKELRISLDQAFCDGAVALGRKNAKGIYFPFGRSVEDIKDAVRDKCKNVNELLIDYCLSFKPYYGADSNGVLWSMNSLAGSTHQSIVGVGLSDMMSFHKAIIGHAGSMRLTINKWSDLHNELEVARLDPGSLLHVQSDFALQFQIVFSGRAHALSFRPLIESLYLLIHIVERIILGIEAETGRILASRS
jgi:hypothetical protein